jgi:hypothetical protein
VGSLLDDAEDIGFCDDEVFFAVDFDFGAAVFGDEDGVAGFDGEFDGLAVVVFAAGAEGDDLGFLWFFLGVVREVDTAGGFFFDFDALHEHALTEGLDFGHGVGFCGCGLGFCFGGH